MGNVLTILDAQNSNQKQCFTYDSLNRLTKGTTSNDSAKGCTTQLGNGNYDEDYSYDSATGNLLTKTGIGTYTYSTGHPHAVTSTSSNNWSFSYDSNGNMTQRNVGTTYNYAYNAENKLTAVSNGTTASFTYDGDGNRVKTVVGGTTTVFLGNYYEWTSGTVKKYYFSGATRIAMRENSTLIFLSGDHLGSTSLVYKTDTGLVIKKLYKPWGETRYTSTTMPTKYQFTGQYRESSLGGTDGIYYFVARWYDQALGRFLQADTIVPKPGDVQAWDRYAYVLNNPLGYLDPTGHSSSSGDCSDPINSLDPTCKPQPPGTGTVLGIPISELNKQKNKNQQKRNTCGKCASATAINLAGGSTDCDSIVLIYNGIEYTVPLIGATTPEQQANIINDFAKKNNLSIQATATTLSANASSVNYFL